MNACKYSAFHACDETCKDGCRVMRTMKPNVEWFGNMRLHSDLNALREKYLPAKIPFPEARLARGVGPKTIDAMIAAGWVDMTPPENPKKWPWTNHWVRRCAKRLSILPNKPNTK